ncbi:MAG: bifunctional DedA family/phosphatase PAP2 family protein [Gemmatimonadaceae bacterium]
MHATFTSLVSSYGYAFIFLIVAVESFGIPLPGETALVTAAAFAALGRLDIYAVIAAAAAGAIVGDNAGYWLGRTGGIRLVQRFGRRVGLDERKLERVRGFFDRHGPKTVFIGRFVALLRSWAAVLAGVAHMPYGTFTLYNALGGVIWASLFGALGYAFGRNLPRLEHYLGQATLAVALLIAVGVASVIVGRWFHINQAGIAERVTQLWQRLTRAPRMADFQRRRPRLWAFVAARFTRGGYLGLHLTTGFLVSLAALWLFWGVTEDVIPHDPLTEFDLTLAESMHARTTPFGYTVFRAISLAGSPVTMAALGVVVGVLLGMRRERLILGGWVAAFIGADVLNWMLKHLIHRQRPAFADALLYGESFSFPSGHAMGALVGYGMLAYVLMSLLVHGWRGRFVVTVAVAGIVLAIGFSRLYLGVHYFSDVVGGYAAGVVWLAACISGIEVARRQRMLAPG